MSDSPARDRLIALRLQRWFSIHARRLPWRSIRRTAYRALVSEFMLQQTQVSRVIPAYRAFIKAFPTLRSLAGADEQHVLRMWKGLGYYRRARHLWLAAKKIHHEFNGRIPRTVDQLQTLPGVGRYTAGAIASIVYHRPEPIVDGNVLRVLSRIDNVSLDTRRAGDGAWARAQQLVSAAARPGIFNEALMELGATVCLPPPASPRCSRCPLRPHCKTYTAGLMNRRRAAAPPAPPKPVAHHHAFVITRVAAGRTFILMQQRPAAGMWAGLWQAPTIESSSPIARSVLRAHLKPLVGLVPPFREQPLRFTHQTTHRQVEFHVYRHRTRRMVAPAIARWFDVPAALALPMGNAQRKAIDRALAQSSR